MLEKNITIKGIFIAILFITMGVSGVSLTIENVDTDAGTLDIYMTNAAGCSYCPVSTYNNNTQNWVEKKEDDPNLSMGEAETVEKTNYQKRYDNYRAYKGNEQKSGRYKMDNENKLLKYQHVGLINVLIVKS